jgi:hypothetical protein
MLPRLLRPSSPQLFEHNTGGIAGVGLYQQRITMSGRVFAQNHGFTQASSTIENVDLTIQVRQANDLNPREVTVGYSAA